MVKKTISALYLVIASASCVSYTPPPTLPASITEIKDPKEVEKWLETVLSYQYDEQTYGKGDFWAACGLTYENKKGDCEDYAICAAALLQGDVEKGYIISLYGRIKDDKAHAVFAYQQDGRWGVISNQPLEFREPLFVSLDEVINNINNSKDPPERYTKYTIYDYTGVDLVSGRGNLESQMEESKRYYLRLSP
jgi:hypothetical protein